MKNRIAMLLVVGMVAALAGSANAVIITPTVAKAKSSVYDAGHMIDGSGLSSGGSVLTETHGICGDSNATHWQGTTRGIAAQILEFTLSTPTNVGAVHIWNYDRNDPALDKRSLASFDMYFSTNGGSTYTTTPISITNIVGGDTALTVDTNDAQTFTFATQANVTNIKLMNLVNHGDTSYVALAEVRFEATPVPEPATMSLLALGGLAIIRKRRK
ncbi:MAG: PEP-CTERM sorting domain-containing protein [bacterium]|nr:PEP-CTERM sorting domain-containing protein [bacterium]